MENKYINDSNEINNRININQEIDVNNIIPENLSLYLNMIGGHSFFVEYCHKYLIKSIGKKELKFYEFLRKNNIDSIHLPKFYGYIVKGSKSYENLVNYKMKCDIFFKSMVQFFQIKLEDIDIENEDVFKVKFKDFVSGTNDINNNNIILDKSFDNLKEELIKIKRDCQKKLYWIFYWYIKWQKEFITDKYIIIQNLQFETKFPSVIDIKLGNGKKISKETGKVKIFKGAYESMGCRIMGISSNNLYFKSRYETKELSENKFLNELFLFFANKKKIITSVINELKEIIKFVEYKFCLKIFFCSLLIFFDNSHEEKDAIVKLIDFDLTNNNKDDLNYEIKNIEKNTDNQGLIQCMNNLVNLLEKLMNIKNKICE